ncbi:MAG: S41 family peptidase [Prevotella sp.]|nr:S41 family peptidase [Prevotella sp.]
MKIVLRHIFLLLSAAALLLPMASCVDEEEFDNNQRGNFEALWKLLDEHYCFFSYKKQVYGLDWNEVHARYSAKVTDSLTTLNFFDLMAQMTAELRDGHVNLYSDFDTGRYWSWHENYPSNVSDTLLRRYLGTDYRMAGGMKYRTLADSVGYIRLESFTTSPTNATINDVLLLLSGCKGLIIDLRDNGGGLMTAAQNLAEHFADTTRIVGYMRHKTGKGHNDFSPMEAQTIRPSGGVRWLRPTILLTNRSVYSAANEFVKYMKCFPQVIVVGDSTGGGAGMPFSGELPNGWAVRFSACPMYDKQGRDTEFGIAPDYQMGLLDADVSRGKDTLIDFACGLIMKK